MSRRSNQRNLRALEARSQQRATARTTIPMTERERIMQMPFDQVVELAVFNGVQAMNTLGQLQQAVQANQQLATAHDEVTRERDQARADKQSLQAELDQVKAELE